MDDSTMIPTGPCELNDDPHPRSGMCKGWHKTGYEPIERWDREAAEVLIKRDDAKRGIK